MKAKILLIDNEMPLSEMLLEYLNANGYEVFYAPGGLDGLAVVESIQPDLVLLEVMLPGMNGWEVCKRLRERSNGPIIFVTAKNYEADKLHGFFLGADDYITKPFSFAELNARMRAVLARYQGSNSTNNVIQSDELQIDISRKHVSVDGNKVDLTPTEYRLLETLARHANRTIPLSLLLSEVWGEYCDGDEQHVKQYIWSLRKKIESNPDEPRHLINRRGYGYRFD